jgi:hypothetical protein
VSILNFYRLFIFTYIYREMQQYQQVPRTTKILDDVQREILAAETPKQMLEKKRLYVRYWFQGLCKSLITDTKKWQSFYNQLPGLIRANIKTFGSKGKYYGSCAILYYNGKCSEASSYASYEFIPADIVSYDDVVTIVKEDPMIHYFPADSCLAGFFAQLYVDMEEGRKESRIICYIYMTKDDSCSIM